MSINTSYSKLHELINDLTNQHVSNELKNAVDTYYKGDYDLAINKILEKLDLINKQEVNKDCFVVYADTSRLKSSFNYNNIALYNYIMLNDSKSLDFIVNNIDKYNFTEHNYTNYSRIFFDIDFDNLNNTEELKMLFKLINEIQDKYKLKAYGLCEINSKIANDEEFDFIFESYDDDEIYYFTNDKIGKLLTGHIYLNGYCNRFDLMNYMKALKDSKGFKSNTFDITVYKTTKQALRMSYSPKIKEDGARYISEKMIDKIKNDETFKALIKNLRMAPCEGDKLIELPKVETLEITKSSTIKKINGEAFEDSEEDKDVSIFQYIMYNKLFTNVKDLAVNGFFNSCFEFSGKLMMFKALPLSVEEFNEEFNNLVFDENGDFKKEVIEGLKQKTLQQMNYKQDFSKDDTLYIYKSYLYAYYDKLKDDLKETDDEETVKNEMKTIESIINKYDFYIEKYGKECFVQHEFYDLTKTYKKDKTKFSKIIYNCYKSIDGAVYYCGVNPVKVLNNITQFRNYFKLNSTTANKIYDNLVCFENEKEFKNMLVVRDYNRLKQNVKVEYEELINKFVNLLKQTFIHEKEFDYYLSFYANKLNLKRTLNKGIINQGTEQEGAHNSLKTYFNDLLNNYLNIVSGDVNNINKCLNGGYFEGELLVIEETPKNIKDVTNFINVLKMYSSKKVLTIEKKGMNPINIINNSDTIINTNHTTSTLFYNKNDCEALIKRFKIIQRKSLSNEILRDNKTLLDEFSNNEVLKYMFMLYIKNYDMNVFYDYKDVYNNVELLYINSSCEENEVDKLQIDIAFDEWIEFFKANYQNKNNYLIVSKLLERLGKNETFKNMKQKTFKAMIIRLLMEEGNENVKIDDNGHIVMTKATRDDYMKIYKHFYVYVENDLKTEEEADKVEL